MCHFHRLSRILCLILLSFAVAATLACGNQQQSEDEPLVVSKESEWRPPEPPAIQSQIDYDIDDDALEDAGEAKEDEREAYEQRYEGYGGGYADYTPLPSPSPPAVAPPPSPSSGPGHPSVAASSRLVVDQVLRYATVFYGTNRVRGVGCRSAALAVAAADRGCLTDSFYASDSAPLEVGTLTVTFPRRHQPGQIERPFEIFSLRLRDEDPTEDVVIAEVHSYGSDLDSWAAAIRDTGHRSAFIYVHGFATNFEEAGRRAAQIAYDIDYAGLPMLYSWPSTGSTVDYLRDYDEIRLAIPPFQRFLRLVADEGGLDEVHVIAHSMGNQLVASALHEMALAGAPPPPQFANLVMAAPDLDSNEFVDRFSEQLPRFFPRVTIYVSDEDLALREAQRLRRRPRAGQVSGGLLQMRLAGIEVIDASGLEADFLSHSYYAASDSVRADLYCLMAVGATAAARPLLEFIDPAWRFKPLDQRRAIDAASCDVNTAMEVLSTKLNSEPKEPDQAWAVWLLAALVVTLLLTTVLRIWTRTFGKTA